MAAKIWDSKDGIEYVSLTKTILPEALEIIKNVFFKHELVSTAVGLSTKPESIQNLLAMVENTALDGVSLVAIEKSTRKVIVVSFNKIVVSENMSSEHYFTNLIPTNLCDSSKAWIDLFIDIDNSIELFKIHDIDCYMEIMFLAVLPQFRCRGIAKNFFRISIELAQELKKGNNVKISLTNQNLNLEPIPKMIDTITTCPQSKKLAESFGFVPQIEISYKSLFFMGKNLSERLGNEKLSIVVAAIKL